MHHGTATTVRHLLAAVPPVDATSVDPATGLRGTQPPHRSVAEWCGRVQAAHPRLRLLEHRYDELAPVATVAVWTDARADALRTVRARTDGLAWLAGIAAVVVGLLAAVGLWPVALGLAAGTVLAGATTAWDLAHLAAATFSEGLDRSTDLYRNGMLLPEAQHHTDRLRCLTRRGADLTNREIHRLAQEIATTDPVAAEVFAAVLHGRRDLRVVDAARTAIATSHWSPVAVAA